MKKELTVILTIAVSFFTLAGISYAQEKQAAPEKAKSFWQKLFDYPANVTSESAGVVTEAVTGTVGVVTKEVKTVGQVTSGSLDKTQDLVTGPLTGTAETTTTIIEGVVAIPAKANKEEPK